MFPLLLPKSGNKITSELRPWATPAKVPGSFLWEAALSPPARTRSPTGIPEPGDVPVSIPGTETSGLNIIAKGQAETDEG